MDCSQLFAKRIIGPALPALGFFFISLVSFANNKALPQPREQNPMVALENSVAANEAQVAGLVPGAERKFFFAHPQFKAPSPIAFLYLHGFSASRLEISPVPELLAHGLGANLFFGRLRGHGIRGTEGLRGVRAVDWQEDIHADLEIARKIGKRVVVLAMSTAAPLLAVELAKNSAQVDAAIFLSPNFGLARWDSELLLWPVGKILLRYIFGEYREWEPKNKMQSIYWTTKYPATSLIEVMRAVEIGRKVNWPNLLVPTQIIYSKEDEILDLKAIRGVYGKIGARKKELYEMQIPGVGHILAGTIIAPQATETVKNKISEFLNVPVL